MAKKLTPKPDDQVQLGDPPNLATLIRAHHDGRLAMVRARQKSDGAWRTLLCAMGEDGQGNYVPSPLAVLIWGDPYELFEDPFQERPHAA